MAPTLAPVIIATDKTQLTQFSGSKSAYPVYLTLGNFPKAIRRKPSQHACILLGYLSVDKIRRSNMTKRAQRARNQRLFHESMRIILEPLKAAGRNGIELTGGDGAVRLVHPVLASYVADFPEQCLVTCSKYGTCPKCQRPATDLQNPIPGEPRTHKWTTDIIQDAKNSTDTPSQFHDYCMNKEVSGSIHTPFWQGFPYANIHLSMTPDVLHQLYQGVFKHLIHWCQTLMTKDELDERIRTLPPSYGIRHFKNGISSLSQISGPERKAMAKILLGCLIGKMPAQGIRACRALLDFIYLAQYTTHDDHTLQYMQDALNLFHANRQYFITTGIRVDFNIPKFHSLLHYITSIQYFGTTDNYNTETFERLHIDFAKEGWRASNHKNELPQMITWLERQEKVAAFEHYVDHLDKLHNPPPPIPPNIARNATGVPIKIAKFPHSPACLLTDITLNHNTPSFIRDLKEYLNTFNIPPHPNRVLETMSLPFEKIDVYHLFKFVRTNIDDDIALEGRDNNGNSLTTVDDMETVRAVPAKGAAPARFDTVVVLDSEVAESTGIAGTSLTQLFCLYLTCL